MNFYRPPTLQGVLDALGSVSKALRAWKFYPQGHPTRKNSITQAHSLMLALLDGNNLSLNSGRTDFSFPDGESLKDGTRMSSALSYELFIRRVLKITFMADLSQDDLLAFIRLLTTPPEKIQQSGGMEKLMAEQGIRTIWTNEFDLSIISARRKNVENKGIAPRGLDDVEAGGSELQDEQPADQPVEFLDADSPASQIQQLIGKLATTESDEQYLQLVRQAMSLCRDLKQRQELHVMVPLVELLALHAHEPGRPEVLVARACYGIDQLAHDDVLLNFFLKRLEQPDGISHDAALALLKSAGQSAILQTVERLGSTENLALRKSLSMLLAELGEEALPVILSMLNDPRWYVVRNLVAVLGEIGSPEPLEYVRVCLFHPDVRVSKEAVRSLAKIGGDAAEEILVSVLHSDDRPLFPQTIASLGGMKSVKGLNEMMRIVRRWDPLLKNLQLKLEALQAISMTGDCQVVSELIEILDGSHLLVPKKREQLKVAIVETLEQLGDLRSVPVLGKLSVGESRLAQASRAALEVLERVERKQHEVA